ncbi:MAG: sensor domain-containing diguanylate cyclase, partial [Proteobacteria bacterium]|nr:sensor domain-containing diguanylate cyclase [Pseudomonadota bacterium]
MVHWLISLLHRSALIRSAFLFVAWLAVWQLGLLVEYTKHASVWFPAAGFTFSCFLVLGRRAFLPIMAAAIVITIWNGDYYQLSLTQNELIWAGFLFGLAHIIPYWIGATRVGRVSHKAANNAPKLIITFLLVAGISALFTTVLVISSLVVTNQIDISEVSQTLLPFWVGDMAG